MGTQRELTIAVACLYNGCDQRPPVGARSTSQFQVSNEAVGTSPCAIALDSLDEAFVLFWRPPTLDDVRRHLGKPSFATVFVGSIRHMFGNSMPLGWVGIVRILCANPSKVNTTRLGGGRPGLPLATASRRSWSSFAVHERRSRHWGG